MIHDMVKNNGVDRDSYWYVDIAAKCPDPVGTENVPHETNGLNAMVQRAVFSQPQFYALVAKFLNDFSNYALDLRTAHAQGTDHRPLRLICSGECRSGFHRADTWGRTSEALLNSLIDADGVRIANCKHFSMSECTGHRSRKSTGEAALDWLAAPWLASPCPLALPSPDRYGFEGAMHRKASATHYGNMWRYVETLNAWGFKATKATPERPSNKHKRPSGAATIEPRGAQAFLSTPGAKGPGAKAPVGAVDRWAAAAGAQSAVDAARSTRAGSAHRAGRRTRAPSQKRGSNKQDPRSLPAKDFLPAKDATK